MEKYPRYNGTRDLYTWLRDIACAMDVKFIGQSPPDFTRINFSILHLEGTTHEWGIVKDIDTGDKFGEDTWYKCMEQMLAHGCVLICMLSTTLQEMR